MSKIKAVLLDFDGTIADTAPGIFECLDYACKALGKNILSQEDKIKFVGPPLSDSFRDLVGCKADEVSFAIMKYRELYNHGAMLHLNLYEGISEFLCEMKKSGIYTAICSSKPAPFVRKITESVGIDKMIDYIASPEADGVKKNKMQMIEESINHFNISKDEALMVGDRHFDIIGAVEANVKSVGVTYGYGTEKELIAAGADYIADSVNELQNIVFSPGS